MTDKFIDELNQVTDLLDTDYVAGTTDPSGSHESLIVSISNLVSNFLKRNHYQITRTVSSNNLTVAVKDSNGNDATSTKPISFNINGNIRKLSGTLSITINAGASTFNLGAAAFATLSNELFVYVGWKAATSAVFLGLSRMAHGSTYADFSSTATDENHMAVSTTPASTDEVTVIGRVNVANSGTASFNWSVPATNTIIHRPIYETTFMNWSPTLTGFSANPGSAVYKYMVQFNRIILFIRQASDGTSNANSFTISLPFTAKTISNMAWGSVGACIDNGATQSTPAAVRVLSAGASMNVFKDFTSTNNWTTSGGKRLTQINALIYEIGT